LRSLARVVGAVALLLVLAAVALVLLLDRIAAAAVEAGATQATGLPAEVGSAHVGLLAGRFVLSRFRLANPAGYGDEPLAELAELRVDVPRNLLAPTVRIPELAIVGLQVHVHQRGTRSNVGELLQRMESTAGTQPVADADARELRIERLVIRETTAHVQLERLRPLVLKLPEIVLRDVGGRGNRSQHVAEITRRVLGAVLQAVARNRELPRQLAGELASGLQDYERAARALGRAGREAGESARDAFEGLFRRKRE
jgi:hypothetical protein